ncbi:hypothetical protein [Paraburkholderia sp. J7]|uniref:hypothetical protein n=1 Tax=Paraburkholderia sp. J7 TaxID=2805438 RepID=UPI002AB741FF|nr:hypothetical protein [Paraburkholderia sp. J7]
MRKFALHADAHEAFKKRLGTPVSSVAQAIDGRDARLRRHDSVREEDRVAERASGQRFVDRACGERHVDRIDRAKHHVVPSQRVDVTASVGVPEAVIDSAPAC